MSPEKGFWESLPLFPDSASTLAPEVDAVYFFGVGVAIFFSILVALLVLYFAVRYRRRHADEVGQPERTITWLEVTWSVIPFLILMVMFAWGAKVFFIAFRPPSDAVEYYVVGKQWMWKFQHPQGKREINDLHVPVGQPIKLTMTSEDVIHSFFVPAFRVKADVVPGRYTTVWFEATKTGAYRLFCAEYCGAEHSLMGGTVFVMEPRDYEAWLSEGDADREPPADRRGALRQVRLQHLPLPRFGRPRADPLGPLRRGSGAGRWPPGGGRRELPARVDPQPGRQHRRRLPAADADLPRTARRGGADPADRLHQGPRAGSR